MNTDVCLCSVQGCSVLNTAKRWLHVVAMELPSFYMHQMYSSLGVYFRAYPGMCGGLMGDMYAADGSLCEVPW